MAQLKNYILRADTSSKQNIILIHGVEEIQNTDVYDSVTTLISTKINIRINKNDINCCYRLGAKKPGVSKPRPVVVSFCRRWQRDQIFYSKKHLKASSIMFTEMLSVDTLAIFRETRKHFKNECWTKSGQVIVLKDGVKVLVNTHKQLGELIPSIS